MKKFVIIMACAFFTVYSYPKNQSCTLASPLASFLFEKAAIPTTTLAHDGTIHVATFSPDGHTILTCSDASTAKLWDAETNKLLYTLKHDAAILSGAFSPDGIYVLTGSKDSTARLWDVSTSNLVHTFTHTGTVNCLAFSPDSKMAITGSTGGTPKLWDVKSGQLIHNLASPNHGSVWSTEFSPDGTMVLTGTSDQAADQWYTSNGDILCSFLLNGIVFCVGFSPDGSYLYTATEDGYLKLFETISGEPVHTFNHGASIRAVTYCTHANYMLSGGIDGKVNAWDVVTGKKVATISLSKSKINNLSFDPLNSLVGIVSEGTTLCLWYVPLTECRKSLAYSGAGCSASFNVQGDKIVVGTAGKGALVVSLTNLQMLMSFIESSTPEQCALLQILYSYLSPYKVLKASREQWYLFKNLPKMIQELFKINIEKGF